MNPHDFNRAEELFHRALAVAPGERSTLLDAACTGDANLRSYVENLLNQSEDERFLDPPPLRQPAAGFRPGRTVGPYRLERIIASGGMGTVYEATQERPQRRVALKVLSAGLGSTGKSLRFEFESQVLARLRHPAIAQVYEAGIHEDAGGRVPYFAMELVGGASPINRYADEHGLSRAERLALFLRVCAAVHYGHQQGVIHRDLKPPNILVDADGNPKLIDFGIARVTDGSLPATTMTAGFSGTLAYMAPEQCRAGATIDTRCDVYALGIVLYQLLCGAMPYDVSALTLPEAAGVIADDPPRRPANAPIPARGDLETIILKALEKAPDRRYQSAAELARDLERFISHQPIDARPQTLRYQLRMFARRHRATVAAAAAVAATLVIATAVSAWFAHEAAGQARRAVAARDSAQRAAEFLKNTLASANPMLPAKAVPDLLEDSAEPWADWRESPWAFAGAPGQTATVADILSAAAPRLETTFADDPLAHAMLADTIGWTLFRLDRPSAAEPLLRRALALKREALGSNDQSTVHSMLHLAEVLQNLSGRHTEAGPLYTEAVAVCEATQGNNHPTTLDARGRLAFFTAISMLQPAEAAAALEPALAVVAPTDLAGRISLAKAHMFLAFALAGMPEREAEARALAAATVKEMAAAAGPDSIHTGRAMELACSIVGAQPEYLAATEDWRRRSIAIRTANFGEGGYSHAMGLTGLAEVLSAQGRSDEAVAAQRESYRLFLAMYGNRHFETVLAKSRVGIRLCDADPANTEGRRLLDESWREMADHLGAIEPYSGGMAERAQRAAWDQGDHAAAIDILTEAATRAAADPPQTARAGWVRSLHGLLAERLIEAGRAPEAADALRRGIAALQLLPNTDSDVRELRAMLDHLGDRAQLTLPPAPK